MGLKRTGFKPYMLLPLLPIVAIAFFCIRYNQNIFNYYLPSSNWNDEVIYYKTIGGIVEYGIPQGYFGYNESHAVIGTFGAWSPVIYVFDSIWGKVFGWNLYSPIVARLVFTELCIIFYSVITKPDFNRAVSIILFVSVFPLFARFVVSQMADCYIITLLIVFVGLYEHRDSDSKKNVLALATIVVVLTLIRPYYVLLWLVLGDTHSKIRTKIVEVGIAIASLAGYFIVTRYFTAAYFSDLINLDWLRFIIVNPKDGISNILHIFIDVIAGINEKILLACVSGNDVGCQYLLFYIFSIILLVLCVKTKSVRTWGAWFIINVLQWLSIVLLYDANVGSRHLMPYIIVEGILILNYDIGLRLRIFIILITCYLCFIKLSDPYSMTIPIYSSELDASLQEINRALTDEIEIDDGIGWNNTVLWVLSDIDGSYPWYTLYAIPEGMGINICTYDYVYERFNDLHAKYITCTAGGNVAKLCEESGYRAILIRGDLNICFYSKN